MIDSLATFAAGAALAALAAAATVLLNLLRLRRRLRRAAELAELRRHQALPPLSPEAWTQSIQIAPVDVVLPDRLHYRGHTLRIVVRRR